MRTSIFLLVLGSAILMIAGCKKDTGGPIAARVIGALPPEKDRLPTANAGPDVFVIPPAQLCKLYGWATIPKIAIKHCMWQKISGPSAYRIDDPASFTPTVDDLVGGVYEFELTIIDEKGFVDVDTVTVTVGEMPTPKLFFKGLYWSAEGANGTLLWGAVLTVKSIYTYLPVGSTIKVFISAGIPGTWTEALNEGAPGSENALYYLVFANGNLYVWSNAEETDTADMIIY